MAWERRKPGRYFYRSRRVGGRVVKDYFGQGAIGQMAADLAEEARAGGPRTPRPYAPNRPALRRWIGPPRRWTGPAP